MKAALLPMRELISYAVALILYGFGLGVLQVPNPKRIIASRILFALGALSALGASIMWLGSVSEKLWVRALVSILICGLIGWATVEAFRFAGHTEPFVVPPSPSPSPSPSPLVSLPSPPVPTPEIASLVPLTKKTATESPRSQVHPKQPSTVNQTMTNSPSGIQAGGDVTIGGKPPSATPTPNKDRKP